MLRTFGTLYLAAELFDLGESWRGPVSAAVFGGILALFQVKKLRNTAFALGLLGSVARTVYHFPDVANHRNVILVINLLLLGMWIRSLVGRRSLESILEGSQDLLRAAVVVVYFAAAFHKLNTDFFSSEVSCAFYIWQAWDVLWPIDLALPEILTGVLPTVAFLWEAALITLAWPRMQWFGLLLAFSLHVWTALIWMVDFASAMFPLLFLFLPTAWRRSVFEHGSGSKAVTVYAALVCAYPWVTAVAQRVTEAPMPTRIQALYFFMATAVLVAPLITYAWSTRSAWQPQPVLSAFRSPAKAALLLGLLAYAATPYLGLRTAGNFTMFSNLVIYEPHANHLPVPSQARLFDHADDIVWFDEIDPRVRGRHREAPVEPDGLPAIEFRRLVGGWYEGGLRDVHMRIRYRGQILEFADITLSVEWRTLPWWQRWLLDFRSVQATTPNRCRW